MISAVVALVLPFWEPQLHQRPNYTTHNPSVHHKVIKDVRPRKWCGWFLRKKLGIKNPAYNRAIHWLNYGSPTTPQIGAIVVWRHHVGQIVGENNKGWLILSGNDSNKVRTRNWNLKGVVGYRI